jgi:hypothetical protein
MAKASKAWGAAMDQSKRIADAGRTVEVAALEADKIMTPSAQEPVASKPRDAVPLPAKSESVVKQGSKAETVEAKVEKRSTSLYLSGGAMRALRTIAAQEGVRPHRVIDDALRAHFKLKGLDFDDLNARD